MKKMAFILLMILGLSPIAEAQETSGFDPLKYNLLSAQGDAEVSVPVNTFNIYFGFEANKASFDEGRSSSDEIIKNITSKVNALKAGEVQIIRGWDLVRQERISFGAKGRKISNRLIIKVKNFQQGKMHELIAKIIDQSLAVSGDVVLENLEVSISEDVETTAKQQALKNALTALQANADRSAETLGKRRGDPKNISLWEDAPMGGPRMEYMSMAMGEQDAGLRKMVNIQKSFNVQAEIVDHVKIKVRVYGLYELI